MSTAVSNLQGRSAEARTTGFAGTVGDPTPPDDPAAHMQAYDRFVSGDSMHPH